MLIDLVIVVFSSKRLRKFNDFVRKRKIKLTIAFL